MKRWIALRSTSVEPDQMVTPLLALAHTVSSELLVHHNHTVLLEIEGSEALFGGIRGVKRHIEGLLTDMSAPVVASIAGSALGAWLLVQERASPLWCYACGSRTLSRRLDALPLSRLPQALPHLRWLHNIGCWHFADLRRLARSDIRRRTADSLLEALDQAYGRRPFVYQPAVVPAVFFERQSLSYRLIDTAALVQRLKPVVTRFSQWLSQQQLAVRALECQLHHTDRKRAFRPTILVIRFSEPVWHVPTIMALLNAQLEALRLPAAVSHITVMSRVLIARSVQNQTLFEHYTSTASDFKQTLDLLRARVGTGAVRQAHPQADYRPEYANHWPSETTNEPSKKKAADHLSAHPSTTRVITQGPHEPAWLLPHPKALRIQNERPCLESPLHLYQGPYRIETGWWDSQYVGRDYFVAQDHRSRRYWIYRVRQTLAVQWFLHGYFG